MQILDYPNDYRVHCPIDYDINPDDMDGDTMMHNWETYSDHNMWDTDRHVGSHVY